MLSQTRITRKGPGRSQPVLVESVPPRVIGEMSYEQFLQLDEDVFAEWVDGKAIEMDAVNDEHSAVQIFFVKIVPPRHRFWH